MKNCPITPARLLRYLDGTLSLRDAATATRHLADCPTCRRRLDDMRRTEASLVELAGQPVPAETQLRVQERFGPAQEREILTIEEAADLLRLDSDQMAEALNDLPWFELAGQIRFRRQTLFDWIRERERECTRERLRHSFRSATA
jgi:predicted anti-sigma-YlaC factor YlaD